MSSAAAKSSASKSSAPEKSNSKDSAAKSVEQTDSASSAAALPQQAAQTAKTTKAVKAAKAAHPQQATKKEQPQQKAERPRRRLPWGLVACALIVCVLLASIGIFAWDRWLRYDDAADIQGSWIAEGTQITIEIDETLIQITEDVAYEYSLNTSDKTITFTFGDMSGSGLYSFSDNRDTLVIEEQASADIVADFLAFYHLDTLFGLDKDADSQDGDADEAGADETSDDEAGDDSDETSSSDEEGSLTLTLKRVS